MTAPVYRGGLQKVILNQRFYPKIHLHQVLTASVFHFHYQLPFPVSNCPNGKHTQKVKPYNSSPRNTNRLIFWIIDKTRSQTISDHALH